jgi:rhamnogalacturonan acetylesterase
MKTTAAFPLSALFLALGISALSAGEAPPADHRPTVYLIGDSTVNNSANAQLGWGKPIAALFDSTRIKVENKARGGRSSRTYWTEGLWDQVRSNLHAGDFVLMQFGHNDGGSLTEGRGRGSLKGIGEETQTITNTVGKLEEVHTYGWYLRKYVRETKAQGATPIVLSPIPRNDWKEGKVVRSIGYGKWAADIAKEESAPFIDLNEIVARQYEEIGETTVAEKFFGPTDRTHTLPPGAELNAASVVKGIRELKDRPLAGFLAQ